MLRILIADDHVIVRKGIRSVIEANPGWEVCGEAGDGQAALEVAVREQPDVAVLDISLPHINGVALTRRLKSECPNTRVLLFTMHEDEETVFSGLAAGARGYLLKTDAERYLQTAIEALGGKRPYLSSDISEMLLDSAGRERNESRLESLTMRELEIAQLVAEGQSNKRIAHHLQISVKTVECHRAAVMRKVGAKSAAEFVRVAIKHNLIQA